MTNAAGKEGNKRPRRPRRSHEIILAGDFVQLFARPVPELVPQNPAPTRDHLVSIIASKVADPRVVEAFRQVDRAMFLPDDVRDLAYSNQGGIEITETSVASQPSMIARMTEQLGLMGDERVLEIGTGLGYGAAILSKLAREVHTVEIDPELAAEARGVLRGLGFENVRVHTGDGMRGLPEDAPFDAILFTGAIEDLPQYIFQQLAPGGRVVAPIQDGFNSLLYVGTMRDDGKTLDGGHVARVSFQPLLTPEG
jgi:protein-L-isoaspartate(D-aspartate) O-methyltransferase